MLCSAIIFLAVLSINLAYAAYDMTQGSDWKWAYAQMYVNDSLSKLNINNEDIIFARMKVAAADKDCVNIGNNDAGSQWCTWAREDNETLARMLKAQGDQPVIAQENTSKSIWDKIKNFFKKLFG